MTKSVKRKRSRDYNSSKRGIPRTSRRSNRLFRVVAGIAAAAAMYAAYKYYTPSFISSFNGNEMYNDDEMYKEMKYLIKNYYKGNTLAKEDVLLIIEKCHDYGYDIKDKILIKELVRIFHPDKFKKNFNNEEIEERVEEVCKYLNHKN